MSLLLTKHASPTNLHKQANKQTSFNLRFIVPMPHFSSEWTNWLRAGVRGQDRLREFTVVVFAGHAAGFRKIRKSGQ